MHCCLFTRLNCSATRSLADGSWGYSSTSMFLYCEKALDASYSVLRNRRNPWQHPTARLIEFLGVSAVSSLLVAAMPRYEDVNELATCPCRRIPLLVRSGGRSQTMVP